MITKDKLPILGILRGIEENHIEPLAASCINTGLERVEITMNTIGAPRLIKKMIRAAGTDLQVGAGTVLTLQDLEEAINAGAQFIVCPSLIEEVIKECVQNNFPVYPGALTPTEVHKAWDLGATMVKLFPASVFGPSYIKELKGPFDKIKIMAVGGVGVENIKTYFENGADAVAFGGSIFKLQWMREGRFDLVANEIRRLIWAFQGKNSK
jgi:2-dehydro-3-deoxyphosphogluconate aldolase/(4S)-4-hydroxy-2-oxoglutarate aldolase